MNTYELSITRTSHEVTTLQAESPEAAKLACERHHSPDSIEIHGVQEVEAPPEQEYPDDMLLEEHSCSDCRYDETPDIETYFLGCSHPENTGADADFWTDPAKSDCFAHKLPIIGPGDLVIETTESCASCGGVMLKSGENEWCSVCAKLIPL